MPDARRLAAWLAMLARHGARLILVACILAVAAALLYLVDRATATDPCPGREACLIDAAYRYGTPP